MKPTVYIDSMAGLRLLRGAQTVMQDGHNKADRDGQDGQADGTVSPDGQ